MLTRRTTLLALVGVSLAGAAEALPDPLRPDPDDMTAGEDVGQAMQTDLARMGVHEYSDEGIPVFLACEDLGANDVHPSPAKPSELSRRIAADLRRYGDAWQHMHPDAPDTDVSKIIEVLAERDFTGGGRVRT